MKTKRFWIMLLCLAAILICCATLTNMQSAKEIKTADAAAEMGRLLADLARAAEEPRPDDARLIQKDLQAIRALNDEASRADQRTPSSCSAMSWRTARCSPN